MLAWVAIGGLIAVAAGRAASAEVTGRVSVEASKALDELVSVDFDEVPYNRAVRQIKRRSSVPIRMDSKSLTEDWLAVDEPITLHARQITLRSALNLMAQAANPNLDWTIRDVAILVTWQRKAEEEVVIRHEVFDLVATSPKASREKESDLDYESLASLAMEAIEPTTWDDGTGPSAVWLPPDHGTFNFPQTARFHDECEDLFIALREAIRTHPNRLRVGPPTKFENEERLRKRWRRRPP